jgi:hypothetical protein
LITRPVKSTPDGSSSVGNVSPGIAGIIGADRRPSFTGTLASASAASGIAFASGPVSRGSTVPNAGVERGGGAAGAGAGAGGVTATGGGVAGAAGASAWLSASSFSRSCRSSRIEASYRLRTNVAARSASARGATSAMASDSACRISSADWKRASRSGASARISSLSSVFEIHGALVDGEIGRGCRTSDIAVAGSTLASCRYWFPVSSSHSTIPRL